MYGYARMCACVCAHSDLARRGPWCVEVCVWARACAHGVYGLVWGYVRVRVRFVCVMCVHSRVGLHVQGRLDAGAGVQDPVWGQ